MARRMLDLFCGRFGWSKAFATRGWECVGIDLIEPPEIPVGCTFIKADILQLVASKGRFSLYEEDAGPGTGEELWTFEPDFVCASSPCEQFSLHGMKHFHSNPPYPRNGMKLFNHTRMLCEDCGVPYVMENVRAAQKFVGNAAHHCGAFHLWGPGVPCLIPKNIWKGVRQYRDPVTGKRDNTGLGRRSYSKSNARMVDKAIAAIIPPELSNCVANYADSLYIQAQRKYA